MDNLCFNCGTTTAVQKINVGKITWDLCVSCTANKIPLLIKEDADNTLTSVNAFGPFGVLSDWAKDVVFEVPKPTAIYETPLQARIPDSSIVSLYKNHLIVEVIIDNKLQTIHLENIVRNNCDLRGDRALIDAAKFAHMTQMLTNAETWQTGAQFVKELEESFTVIGSFMHH